MQSEAGKSPSLPFLPPMQGSSHWKGERGWGIIPLVMCGHSRRKLPILYSVAIWILANQERKEEKWTIVEISFAKCNFQGGVKILQQSSDNRSVNRKASLNFLNTPKDSKIYFTQLRSNVWLCHRILWSRWRWHEQLNIGETSNWELKMCFF